MSASEKTSLSEKISNPSEEISEETIGSHVDVEFAVRMHDVLLHCSKFGMFRDTLTNKVSIVKQYKWINKNNVEVNVITYGATITKILVPDKKGHLEDIVMGFDDIQGYQGANNPFIGATIGRVANRIAGGKFGIDAEEEKEFKLDLNASQGKHHIHGGSNAFDKKNWIGTNEGTHVRMCLISPDGEGGYPGDVLSTVTMHLDNDNNFHIEMEANSTKATLLNMTNHSYFNLAGHASGHLELYEHIVTINADRITLSDCDLIPTGKFRCIGGTVYDFRIPRSLGHALAKVECNGFDNNFCVIKGTEQKLGFMGRAWHPKSGRFLEVYSDQPGMQFYTANNMPDPNGKINPMETFEGKQYSYKTDDITHLEPISIDMSRASLDEESLICECPSDTAFEPIQGKNGALYRKHGAFCMEPQKYPDAIHHPEFPSIVLKPGETYHHEIQFKFGVQR